MMAEMQEQVLSPEKAALREKRRAQAAKARAARKTYREAKANTVGTIEVKDPKEAVGAVQSRRPADDKRFHYRWVAHDDRDRVNAALEKGYEIVKADEVDVTRSLRGHKGADNTQRWGRDLILMRCDSETRAARKKKEVQVALDRLRRVKEQLQEETSRAAGHNVVIGEITERRY